ncbi:MAG: TonB-dependent receptor domain-containing protein, partial [Candidatus Sulfotelmatobacter sp.]
MKRLTQCVLVFFVLFVTTGLRAQTSQGRILGTITDASGAVVSDAKVTITNTATGVSRSLQTNSVGEYAAPSLDPGNYRVVAEGAGFKRSESSDVIVEVSREVRVNLRLQPGARTETVEVTDQAPLTDTTDATLNGVLTNKAINELPLQGRDFQNLLPLHPGVQRTPGGGFHSVTSNGNRPDDNNFFIDGANDNDVYYGETVVNDAGISGTPASILPLDSIQEFNTQESPTADYGVKPGVVVNMGLKSGTNDLHGTAYYFGRNAALDARNYFNPGPAPASALILHQFGASIGGPIIKGKWFYFANYEGIRDKVGNPGVTDSPVTTSLIPFTSQLNDLGVAPEDYSVIDAVSGPNGCQVSGTCNQLSLSLIPLFLNNPGFTLKSSDPAAINFDFNNINRGDNLVVKSDFVLNQANVISGRLIYSNTSQTEEDGIALRPEWLSHTDPRTQVLGASWVWTPNPRWINEARFSYNRFNEFIAPVDANVNPTSYGLNTGVTDPRLFGFPTITPSVNFDSMGGVSGWPLATTPSATYDFSDTISYNKGKHSLRFGGSFSDGKVTYFRAGYGRGRVDFRSLEDFVAGDVRRWRLLYGDPARDISMTSFGFFAQDTYRVTPRLTLNLGLRYDVTNPIKDSQNRLA